MMLLKQAGRSSPEIFTTLSENVTRNNGILVYSQMRVFFAHILLFIFYVDFVRLASILRFTILILRYFYDYDFDSVCLSSILRFCFRRVRLSFRNIFFKK